MDEYQIVEVPGVGEVEFPVSMSDDEVLAAVRKLAGESPVGQASEGMLPPSTPLTPTPAGPIDRAIGHALTGFGEQAQDAVVGMVELGKGLVTRPVETVKSIPGALVEGVTNTAKDALSGDPRRMGRAVFDIGSAVLPVAPEAAAAARAAGRGAVAAAKHPAGQMAIGGGVGLATGGVPGMITGMAGGGVYGKLDDIAKALKSEKVPGVIDLEPGMMTSQVGRTPTPPQRSTPQPKDPKPVRVAPEPGVPTSMTNVRPPRRKAAQGESVEPAPSHAPTTPTEPARHTTTSKAEKFTRNDLQVLKDEFGTMDIDEASAKFGPDVVRAKLAEKKKARSEQHRDEWYKRNPDKDKNVQAGLKEMLEASLKQRSGKK